ncbi:carbohydrate kinase family protein [Thioclava sp. GXIMD4215]|uniref:carbohydrate kinase family protein n=1 Tax=Thioclava sp. GXIMD4215 TaxID=3131928 RepID=UPI0032550815
MILCAGEALIDMIPTPTVSGGEGFVPHNGGAVFNTAIALGRLGQTAGMLTGLSSDLFGQQLDQGLRDSQVDTQLCIRSDRPTTLAFVKLVDGHASYVFYDENSAGRMLTEADLPPLPDSVNALYFGGISLACEPGADAYAALLARNHTNRAVMIDPNIRPGFIRDAARYRARLGAMLAQSDIVKVSDEDLDWIIPGAQTLPQKAQALQASGPAVVIVTRGAQGASAWLADGTEVSIAAERVTVIDTVGAGDTFNAGILAKLSELGLLEKPQLRRLAPDDMRRVLAFGAKVAAVTVSRAGANPPWAVELA